MHELISEVGEVLQLTDCFGQNVTSRSLGGFLEFQSLWVWDSTTTSQLLRLLNSLSVVFQAYNHASVLRYFADLLFQTQWNFVSVHVWIINLYELFQWFCICVSWIADSMKAGTVEPVFDDHPTHWPKGRYRQVVSMERWNIEKKVVGDLLGWFF